MGDFNIDHQISEAYTSHRLIQSLNDYGLQQLITGITRPASQSCLDHIYTTDSSKVLASGILNYGSSDHLPVYAVHNHFVKTARPHNVIKYRDFKNLDETNFREDMRKISFADINADQEILVNEWVENWYLQVNAVINEHLPLRQKRVKRLRQPQWFTQDLLLAINHRNKLLKKARKTNKEIDWTKYKKHRNIAYYKIRAAKSNYFKTALSTNVNNPKVYWDHMNDLVKRKPIPQQITLQLNNKLTSDPMEVAEAFNYAFVNVASKYIDHSSLIAPDPNKLKQFVDSRKIQGDEFNIPFITKKFVIETINSMSTTKATGLDQISVRF